MPKRNALNSNKVASAECQSVPISAVGIGNASRNGYVPRDMGLGSLAWTVLSSTIAWTAAQIQGEFPIVRTMT